jgi:nitrile hydratase
LTGHDDLPVAARARRLEERLIAAGLTSDDEMDEFLTRLYTKASPVNGARMVARAWADPAYRDRLLADASAAAAELGYGGYEGEFLRCVENTADVHNVIVCTLCSCSPWPVLGIPPVRYKRPPYRSRIVREPRAVLAEFGLDVAEDVEIRVWDSSADMRYMVLPARPPGTDGMGEDELAALVTRDCMIGVAVPRVPAAA